MIAAVVVALSTACAWLASPRGRLHFLQVFGVSAVVLSALMGLGAVFGKTLGDFLRNQ